MRTSFGILALAALTTIASAQSAPPYAGTWKTNPAKSDFGQFTIAYETIADGYKVTVAGQSYTVSGSGKESTTPWGGTVVGKQINATTFETVNRMDGKLVSTDTARISADGKTMTVESKVVRASGGSAVEHANLRRVGSGSGFAGKWQASGFTSTAPARMTIAAQDGGLMLRLDDEGGLCTAKFDGKEAPASGTMWPKGWTCSVARNGDRGFDLAMKREGQPMWKSTLVVSTDGKTLTETGGPVGGGTLKFVYDRQ